MKLSTYLNTIGMLTAYLLLFLIAQRIASPSNLQRYGMSISLIEAFNPLFVIGLLCGVTGTIIFLVEKKRKR